MMSNDWSLVLKWLDLLNTVDAGMELLYKDIFVAEHFVRLWVHSWSLLVKESNAEVLLGQIEIPAEPLQEIYQYLTGYACFFSFWVEGFFFISNFWKYLGAMLCCEFARSINLIFLNVIHVPCNGLWHHSYIETYVIIIDSGAVLGSYDEFPQLLLFLSVFVLLLHQLNLNMLCHVWKQNSIFF